MTIGQERDSGQFYLSIPVSNGLVEYEEYYEIGREEFERFSTMLAEVRALAERCRSHDNDAHLIVEPGSRRGTPV